MPTDMVPDNATDRDDSWKAFRISGILASNGIGIFAVSTYNTDYILTKEEDFERALGALKNTGYIINRKG